MANKAKARPDRNGGHARISATVIRDDLANVANRVAFGGERIILERRGKDVAALVPMDDLALLDELENRIDLSAARKALKEKGTVPLETIKARLGVK